MMQRQRRGRAESSGIYYRRLLHSLMIASSIFAVISLVVFIVVQIQFSDIEKRSEEIVYNSQINLLNVALQYIEQTSSSVDTYVLDSWMDDSLEPKWRYYHSAQLYDWLKASSAKMSGVSYMTCLIGKALGGMVITPTGTCSLDFYFREYANMTDEGEKSIEKMLDEGTPETILIPVYSEEGFLTDLYFAVPYISNESNAVILTRLYISRFLDIADNQYPFILQSDGNVIAMRLDEHTASIAGAIDESNPRIYRSYMSNMLLQYVSYFAGDNLATLFVLYWIILLAVFATLLYFLVYRQAGKLYRPLFDAISADSDDVVINKDTDELELIKERNVMLLQLADRLEKANKEALRYAMIRVYRNLLEGAVGNSEDDGLWYAVAAIKFRDAGDNSASLISFQLMLQIRECEWLHYVPFGFDRFALVIRTDDIKDARAKLVDIVHCIPSDADASVILSSLVKGNHSLHKAYRQCQELLCMLPGMQKQQIIMADDVDKADDGYSFSADDEAVLVNMIASGNQDSLKYFDAIVVRNMYTDKSSETKHNFCLCIVSMVSRIFSDLRTRPVDFIGEEIDYASFYQNMPALEIISRIRDILEKTVQAVSSSVDESDSIMLTNMKRFIHENYMRDIGLQDMADAFNISPKYCGMLFSRLSNDTFKNYLNIYRTEEAKKIMKENPSIKIQDLASMVGFNSPNSFIRVFSRYTGMTPKAYAERTLR